MSEYETDGMLNAKGIMAVTRKLIPDPAVIELEFAAHGLHPEGVKGFVARMIEEAPDECTREHAMLLGLRFGLAIGYEQGQRDQN